MSLYDELPLTDSDRKIRKILGDHVVVKSLSSQAAFQGLPRYVAEYLIAKYVQPESWKDDLAKMTSKIKELLPNLEHRELLKEKLLRVGEVVVIDNIEARIDLKNGQRWVRVPALSDDRVRVGSQLLEQFSGLLLGGLWGTAKIKYSPETDSAAPNELIHFTPFQVGPPDLDAYRQARSQFSSEEWLTLILHSAGYDSRAIPERRHRLLLLARLIPLVERNVNLLELGPRQTGKTFLLRNLSPRVFTISGGKTTPASLFVNLNTKSIGILGSRKVVVFDEIAHASFDDESTTISTLKDYMESGQFSRGSLAFATDASLVYAGNIDVQGDQPDPGYVHLLEPLPRQLIDSAFIDRIHGYIPGWEIPKITPASLAQSVGFVTDYFGEVLVRLRDDSHLDQIHSVAMTQGMTRRDQVAVDRLASGFIKILYPDGKLNDRELHEVVLLAAELRQRVHNQLAIIAAGEFKPKLIAPQGEIEHAAEDMRRQPSASASDPLNQDAIVGSVTGLSVLIQDGKEIGGDLILIQVSAIPGSEKVQVTGRHGGDLKDSVLTAYNIVRSKFREFNVSEARLKDRMIAVHLVRISEPKDGPSAGVAFVVGIISALTGRAVRPATAMTGEVALHGEVLSVGGIARKLEAAAARGRTRVILPAENEKDLHRVSTEIKNKLEIIFVKTISAAVEAALMPCGS